MVVRSISMLETVCVEGFIMDRACIKLGYLLDNPSLKPLENPEQHTVHCLVDVSYCYNSGFSILVPNPEGEPKFREAYKLDDKGNELLLSHSRELGNRDSCSTCVGGGNITIGMRATVIGVIEKTGGVPPKLLVKEVKVSPKLFNRNSESDGCSITTTSTPTTTTPTTTTPPTITTTTTATTFTR